jgi:hypothetical protein
MATYTVTHKQLLDNYAVLQLLTPSEIAVGQSITVSGISAPFRALSQLLHCLNICMWALTVKAI